MNTMNTDRESTSCKKSVLERIEKEDVCPKSRWVFTCREAGVWLLWVTSVLVGALAVAILLFVAQHHWYALYEATHDNFLTFIVDFLPYLWLSVFLAMFAAAAYNLQHTKHGYRYPLWQILLSSFVLSIVGGLALNVFGLGYKADYQLGKQMAMYKSQEKLEEMLWQNPEEGRLVGVKVFDTTATNTVIFEDSTGSRWVLDTRDMRPKDLELLNQNQSVKLLGSMTDGARQVFHPCGAFPGRIMEQSTKRIREVREEFKEHIRTFDAERDGRERDERVSSTSPCLKLPMIQRLRPS